MPNANFNKHDFNKHSFNKHDFNKNTAATFHKLPTVRPITPLLDTVDSPDDLKNFSHDNLVQLANELREFLLYSVGQSGGHFGANLGVVELSIALHKVFDAPNDKLVWDVGHQAYPHKILTGRREQLTSIRNKDGLTAFPERSESKYDTFGVGHSSTAISAGLGMSLAMQHQGKNNSVVAIVGDGAMTGGMAFEAMNDAIQQNANIIVVLNDNDMSISQATGGFSKHLATLWQRGLAVDIDKFGNPIITHRTISSDDRRIRHYLHMAGDAFDDLSVKLPKKISEKLGEKFAEGLPNPAQIINLPEKIANKIADNMFPENLFKAIGFQYFGPFDGHDVVKLAQVFERIKPMKGAVLVHVHTVKGKGFSPAEHDPIGYHAIGKLPKNDTQNTNLPLSNSDKKIKKYSQIFGEFLCDTAKTDKKLMAITPAMAEGSGMVDFAKQFPSQYFDVAIAEQHAITLAGGMACEGVKPIVAIYSTFLQRGYDQLIHDIALQNLDVTFAIDRAGLVGEDGATHAGVFDISFMRCIPNIIIAVPSDENECYQLLNTCYQYQGVAAVRYPRGCGIGVAIDKNLTNNAQNFTIGKAVLDCQFNDKNQSVNEKIALLAFGSMLKNAKQACEIIAKNSPKTQFSVYNMRFVKPLDSKLIDTLIDDNYRIITLEEHQLMGGAGSSVNEYILAKTHKGPVPNVLNIGIDDKFIPHGSHSEQLAYCGLDVDGVVAKITRFLDN
ncbi:1-deoxy-D-xylulose-5-phosphate synthase [Moraxella macacae 0408225]|uniref:1-deoxy-D-xylulose-5-phosphate synthase n=1 Tax=Moraxella macacae 0408225 TaxID=1230338 RepID=L2F7N7_9GAMM|nr:1-deoxy-D-xylulose-5-phosphate synthase [Moraxella macacae]ELA09042.1 1-deoxy-D-xylulose-5-phosphate synthase [Moraxella macacae 0408225]